MKSRTKADGDIVDSSSRTNWATLCRGVSLLILPSLTKIRMYCKKMMVNALVDSPAKYRPIVDIPFRITNRRFLLAIVFRS